MQDVSTFRLYLMRATYALIFVGLALYIWPLMFGGSPAKVEHMRAVVWCMLTTVSLLALLGIRYPLQMLPLMFFELIWKSLWIVLVGLPLWSAGQLAGAHAQTMTDNLFGLILFPLVIPWRYAWHQYIRKPADRWRREAAQSAQ